MKAFSEFYDLVTPELPGITTDMLDYQLRQVARDFCEKTSCWRLPFDDVSLIASQATYDLEPSEPQSAVVRLVSLTLGTQLLWQSDEPHADPQRSHCNVVTPKYDRTAPPFTLSPDLLEITLATNEVPTAALAAGMHVIGAMKPSINATALPDFLLSQYSEAMRFGTLSRLMVMAKKPWTDRALASVYAFEWGKAVNFSAYQAQVGNTRAPLRVRKWG